MASAKAWRLVALCLALVLAMLLAVASIDFMRAKRGYGNFVEKLGKRELVELTLAPIPQSWVVSGPPVCHANKFETALDGSSSSGIWGCVGPAKFNWHYDGHESVYILEGSAEIEYLGNKFSLRAGDSTHFAAGTSATWTVPERVKKTWRIYELGRIERYWSRLTK